MSSYPAHMVVGMPSLSPTMDTGTIGKWLCQAGDLINAGDAVAEIETDKASMAFEAQDEFYIAKILVPEGGEVKV
ncbi:single hybrid motif-containing protein, partial [Ochromonadaceae sp. CCMP2298]